MSENLYVPEGLPSQAERLWRQLDEQIVAGLRLSWLDAVVQAEQFTEGPLEDQVQVLMACLRSKPPDGSRGVLSRLHLQEAVVRRLLSKALPFTPADFLQLAESLGERFDAGVLNTEAIVPSIRRYLQTHPLGITERLRLCDALLRGVHSRWNKSLAQDLIKEWDPILGTEPRPLLRAVESWSTAAIKDLEQIPGQKQAAWNRLLAHCQTAFAGSPTAKWLKAAQELVDGVGTDDLIQKLVVWLPLVDQRPPSDRSNTANVAYQLTIIQPHQELLKGLAWCASFIDSRDLARALTALGQSAYKKVPGIGPRAVKVGNACVYALGAMPGLDGVGQLALLKLKVKFGTAQKLIEKALTQAAERLGMPRDEIEELAVPTYGLEEVGLRRETQRKTSSTDGPR